MISRRDKLLNLPWTQQRYEHHRANLRSAKPAIDMRTPPIYSHVILKPKKVQIEKERLQRIEAENVRLLQKLGDIMKEKRMSDLWLAPRPNFLQREKLFETRPFSSLPKLITIYGPKSTDDYESSRPSTLKSPNSNLVRRCPTCSGKPERTQVAIPEKRIPWAPPRISRNVQTEKVCEVKKCLHCGHPKKPFEMRMNSKEEN
ncbi:uncharacterized protein LOC105665541 [Ceratitis capitata]|uniref:(Mediterranean fruit fly) hypothetical protein n=1 Tax=Ceratitis capitata TaxID=7213 RepID=A0A811TY00_CERCA|nr:uncharacterized protein LOC105665541 [Ceratitis capitata]XP_020718043.1 uncharacterized protein LOC105665541 [Ceratitis capitata]CAD6991619.1 unnamed protein product [Ceratitis capitata]